MLKDLFSRSRLGLGAVVALLVTAAPASAATTTSTVDTSNCSSAPVSQPFLAWKDSNWYRLMPGESAGTFSGEGWTLSGGAKLITTTLADGTTSTVLDLPSGATAVSPVICVTTDYPQARTMVRDVVGSEGVSFYVSYQGTSTWDVPKNTGQFHGKGTDWTLSDPIKLQPYNTSGWQPVKFMFKAGGTTSDFQVYNFYVDPRLFA